MEVIFADDLLEAASQAGLHLDHEPEPGRMTRFSPDGRKGDKAAWVRVFPDGDGAVFGCWRDGTSFTWQRRREGPPPDAAELKRIRQRAEEARQAAEAEREAAYQEAAQKANRTWQAAEPATGHPYLSRKAIKAHIARIRAGWLVLPVFDKDGAIQSVQSVSPKGEKRFMPGGKMQGGRCWLGDPVGAEVMALVEGFATGASIYEATGWPVCVAFTAGNLRPVALDVRVAFPDAKLVVCGDDDRKTEGNPGKKKAMEAAELVGASVLFPAFNGDQGTDFNDLHQQSGIAAVRSQVFEALATAQPEACTDITAFIAPALAAADVRDGTATTRPLTEYGNALRLLDLHRERIRFVPEVSGWLMWRGGWRWEPDGAGVRMAATALPDAIYREGIGHRADAAEHFARWARQSQSLRVAQATVQLLSDQLSIRASLTTIDADAMLLGYDNARSVIDLKTGVYRLASPADYITKSLNVSEVGDARKATRWLAFLDQVFEGDTELIGWIHRWMGYTLTGSTAEQILIFAYGLGANGKSVLGELLRWIMGDYARAIPVETLCESRRQAGGASPDLADLAGARLAMTTETEDGQALAESLIKALTAGDAISARPLYGKPFTFQPQFKLLMMGNHRPIVRGTDHGIWRRIRLVPFRKTFTAAERDPHLPDKLKAEAPHILAWMVDGCIAWQRMGLADVPRVVAAETSSYQGEQDLIGQWLADEITRDPASEATTKDLYASYRQWAIESGLKVASSVALGRRLGERGFRHVRSNGLTKWQGLAVKAKGTGFGGGYVR